MGIKLQLFKVLTRNDTGETGSHQSGITIPKSVALTGVFPRLGTVTLNPRVDIVFYDESNCQWRFQYIYYNDLYFGKPRHQAHDEHRMTCVKDFISRYGIKSGDEIWFAIDDNGVRRIGFKKKSVPDHSRWKREAGAVVIKLSANWKSITY